MQVYSRLAGSNLKLSPFPFRNEMVMQSYLVENKEILKLDGFDDVEVFDFEVSWKKGKDDKGRIDLLVSYDKDIWAVVELKNNELTEEHLEQLESYFKDEDPLMTAPELFGNLGVSKSPKWMAVLVGTGVSSSLQKKLDSVSFVKKNIPLAVVVINRFQYKGQTFVFSDVRKSPKKMRDLSKCEFNGVIYSKRRVVLALVKQCVLDGYSFDEINALSKGFNFKDKKPFILDFESATKANATPTSNNTYYNYYFTKSDEIFDIKGSKYALWAWWGGLDMPLIIKNAASLKYTIKMVEV